jgi:hypothetical protein
MFRTKQPSTLQPFVTSTQCEIEQSATHPDRSATSKEPRRPLNRKMGGPVRTCKRKEKFFTPAGIRITDHPARSLGR